MKNLGKPVLPLPPLAQKILWESLFPCKTRLRRSSYISIHIIRARSLRSCKIFWRVWLGRLPSLLWKWTIIIAFKRVWASSRWPRICCSWPWSRYNYDLSRCISWDGESMGQNFMRRQLWSPMKRIPQMRMGVSLLKCHRNHAHSKQLLSQARLVPCAHTRTTTTLWSSSARSLGGWL